jgi:pimeloyl-ACP methyl ester carboxylesterase
MHQKNQSIKKGAVKKAPAKKAAAKKAPVKKALANKSITVKKRTDRAGSTEFKISSMNFQAEGLNCAGRLYLPAGAKKPPVIIMGNGIGLEMGFGLPLFAEEFAKKGYAVFLFDYRYYGESEGEPRHLFFPRRQLKDWAGAVEFVRTLDKIDADRICLWGYSFSGGHVLATAASNNHIKAFIAHMPYMDSLFIFKINGFKKTMKISFAGYKDLLFSITGKEPVNIPIAGKPDEFAIMNTPEAYDGYLSLKTPGSEWKNEMPARSMLAASFFRPFKSIARIKCRGLVVRGDKDSITDNDLVDKYFEGKEQFELLKLTCGHFEIFKGEYFKQAVSAELRFLKSVFG